MKAKAPLWRRGARYARQLPERLGERLVTPLVGTIRRVAAEEPVAALTFDDGPHPEYTPRLLEILAAHGAKATFFVVGEAVAAQPRLARRMVDEGHALANHTFSHRSLPTLARAERLEQLRRCAEALAPYGGDHRLLRPPYGDQDWATRLDALRLGYRVVTWTYAVQDWEVHEADFFEQTIAEKLRPGSIVLLHDTLYRIAAPELADRSPTLRAVERTLERFTDYAFVTVPELLTRGTIKRTVWLKRSAAEWLAGLNEVENGRET